MECIESWSSFDGEQMIWQHQSDTLNCTMKMAVYTPPQVATQDCPVVYWLAGLSDNERTFIEKSGFQRYASELGVIVVAPDTSPRGEEVANDNSDDLGQGASFYLNATQQPWATHYQMYDYITQELPELINQYFRTNGKQSISGHSMGGYGALMIALRNPEMYQSVSAFAPVIAPMQTQLGKKVFTAYLGTDKAEWEKWDIITLLKQVKNPLPILVEQGLDDEFLDDELNTALLESTAKEMQADVTINYQEDYDHSYFFVSSFIDKHLAYHAKALK